MTSRPISNRQFQRFTTTTQATIHVRHNQRAASNLAQTDQKQRVLRQHHTLVLQKSDHHVLRGNRSMTLTTKHH